MNNPSPLIPQGSIQDQKNRSRTRLRAAFIFIASIHIVGFVTLLTMQGCKNEQSSEITPDPSLGSQTFDPTNTIAMDTNVAPTTATNTTFVDPYAPTTNTMALTAPTATEYVIIKGDSFYTIGKAHGVSIKAIQEANPGVDSTKLKIGQKIVLPAPTTAPAATDTVMTPATTTESYTVVSGDTLTSIAKKFSITVNQLRSANSLTTDRIKVGDKLKIPAKAPGAMIAPAAPAMAAAPAAPTSTTVVTH